MSVLPSATFHLGESLCEHPTPMPRRGHHPKVDLAVEFLSTLNASR